MEGRTTGVSAATTISSSFPQGSVGGAGDCDHARAAAVGPSSDLSARGPGFPRCTGVDTLLTPTSPQEPMMTTDEYFDLLGRTA
ncbi:hypothetical protein [Brachybacterium sacelli]|uniref:hypothetical protein n=1 Tax=Brachybacterium sacelli TaxID=173364 RepID=UPI0036089DAD